MKNSAMKENCKNCKRVCTKMAVILCAVLIVLAGLAHFVDGQAVSDLKNNFSLGIIIALVLIINLVSFLCFVILYAAYQWVRSDLKPVRSEDVKD